MKTVIISTTLALFLLSGCTEVEQSSMKKDDISDVAKVDLATSKTNKIPVATFDKFSINRGVKYNGQLNATDADGDEIRYKIVKQPQHGSIVLQDNGCFTYISDGKYKGKDRFSYRASDDVSSCATKIVTVDVCDKPISKPIAPSDLKLEALSTSKVKISWNDNSENEDGFEIFIDGKLKRVKKANSTYTTVCRLKAGESYSIKVRAKNIAGVSQSIEKSITTKDVTTLPEAPTNLIVKSKDENSIRLSWKDNADNESSYEIYQDGVFLKSISSRCNCVLICNLDSCKDYNFEVRAKNKIGESTGDSVDVMTEGCVVEPVNHAPVANDINITKEYDGAFGFDIALIGTDADGDNLTYTIVSGPTLGSIDPINGNIITYHSTPDAEPSIITYKVNDGKVDSNIATVTINVAPVNDAPTADEKSVTVEEDSSNNAITLSGNDIDGDTLTFIKVSNPSHGTVTMSGNIAKYTPTANYFGTDSFTYKVNDGSLDSNIATVNITVNDVAEPNQAPTVNLGEDKTITIGESITVNSHATDIDGTVVDHTWISNQLGDDPENSSTVTFTTLTVGKHEIKVFVTDDDGLNSNTDSMIITVLPAPTPSKLLKTGQISSYDENGIFLDTVDAEELGIKDDGYYQAGIDRNFTSDDDTLRHVIDNNTGTVWQNFHVEPQAMTLSEAINYCENRTYNGQIMSLPKIEDLFYLKNFGGIMDDAFTPTSPIREFWSTTTLKDDSTYKWVMKYVQDIDGFASTAEDRYVRCIQKSGNEYQGNFVRYETLDAVEDRASNLMWQDTIAVSINDKISWKAAIDYCEGLTLLGVNDWRLPNINELYSIGDRSKKSPAIYSQFKNINYDYYWSSTTAEEDEHFLAFAVEFDEGNSARFSKRVFDNDVAYVRCVRTK